MNHVSNTVRHGRVGYAAVMTKMNAMVIRDSWGERIIDHHELVDGLWMTCGRPVKGGGYLTAHLVFSDPLWQLTRTHMSVRGQAVTT